MKIPDPVAWYYTRDNDSAISFAPDRDPEKHWQKLYSEAQLREALAQQERDTADGFAIAHLQGYDQAKRKYEAVMRMALGALTSDEHCNCIPTPLTDEAIKALEEQLK